MESISKHRFLLKHSTVGRMRFQDLNQRLEMEFARALESMLTTIDGVLRVEARENTGSVIIFYMGGCKNSSEIGDQILAAILKLEQGGSVLPAPAYPTTGKSSQLTSLVTPIAYETLKLIVATLALAYTFARSYFFRNPLSSPVLTAIAIAGMLPAVIRSVSEIIRGNHLTINLFSVSACLLSIMSRSYETALEIIWLSELGDFLDKHFKQNLICEVRDLFRASSGKAFILVDGVEVEIDAALLEPGMILCLSKGENCPVDGRIVRFSATIDESGLTDSVDPVLKSVGDEVLCGSLVMDGKIQISAEKTGKDTHLNAALAFVEKSLAKRATAKIEAARLADRMLFLGLLVSVTTFLLTGNLRTALAAQLITVFPCATFWADSITIAGALVKAARGGALVKGGHCLEKYSECDSFCFDQKGALTETHSVVAEVKTRSPWIKRDSILRMAIITKGLSKKSQATCVTVLPECLKFYLECGDYFEEIPESGVQAAFAGDEIVVGSAALMDEIGADRSYFRKKEAQYRSEGFTTVFVAKNTKIQGMIVLTSPTRSKARESIEQLKALGIKEIHILSEDHEQFVSKIAHQLEIDCWLSDALPDHRADYVRRLQERGRKVVMVGDGRYDARELSTAYVGISMGKEGAYAILNAPDINLANSNLLMLPELKRIANMTFQIIKHNHYLFVARNLWSVVMAVTGNFNPVMAGALHLSHAMAIFANSSRILNKTPIA